MPERASSTRAQQDGRARGRVGCARPSPVFVATSTLAGMDMSRSIAIGSAVAVAAVAAFGLGTRCLLPDEPLDRSYQGSPGAPWRWSSCLCPGRPGSVSNQEL